VEADVQRQGQKGGMVDVTVTPIARGPGRHATVMRSLMPMIELRKITIRSSTVPDAATSKEDVVVHKRDNNENRSSTPTASSCSEKEQAPIQKRS
jgi:hypothetical protein